MDKVERMIRRGEPTDKIEAETGMTASGIAMRRRRLLQLAGIADVKGGRYTAAQTASLLREAQKAEKAARRPQKPLSERLADPAANGLRHLGTVTLPALEGPEPSAWVSRVEHEKVVHELLELRAWVAKLGELATRVGAGGRS